MPKCTNAHVHALQVAKKRAEVKAHQERVAALTKEEAAAAAALAALDEEVAALAAQAAEVRGSQDKVEAELAELRAAAAGHSGEALKLKRAAGAAETEAERLAGRMRDVLAAAEMDHVPLPTRRKRGCGSAGDDEQDEEDEEEINEEADQDAMEVDDGDGAGTSAGGGGGGGGGGNPAAHLDFGRLDKAARAARGAREREAADADLRAKIDELSKELAARAPNLKAVEQYAAVKEKEREHQAALDEARSAAAAAAEGFDKLRQQRHERFMKVRRMMGAGRDGKATDK